MAVSKCIRVCRNCSKQFSRSQKYESTIYCQSCIEESKYCRWCKAPFEPGKGQHVKQKYCSLVCANHGKDQARGLRYTTTTFTCIGCQTEVTRSVRKYRDSGKYCSRDCSFRHISAIATHNRLNKVPKPKPDRSVEYAARDLNRLIKREVTALQRIANKQRTWLFWSVSNKIHSHFLRQSLKLGTFASITHVTCPTAHLGSRFELLVGKMLLTGRLIVGNTSGCTLRKISSYPNRIMFDYLYAI